MQNKDQTAAASDSLRATLIEKAVRLWTAELVDLSGNNTLLFYTILRRGTLDFVDAVPLETAKLLSGRSNRLGKCFPGGALEDAAARARTISGRARAIDEERGVNSLYLAVGLATWENPKGASKAIPSAPILLRPIALRQRSAAGADFDIEPTGDYEVNPVLLHYLATEFGLSTDEDELLELLGNDPGDASAPDKLFDTLSKLCADVSGWEVAPATLIGTFSYTKLPLVRDLETAHEELAQHDLLAAIAGDPSARDTLRDHSADIAAVVEPPPPRDEFIVLDSDSSQSLAIDAAVRGANLVIIGPPGTGKSQTIANLIATLIAHGRVCLFVAEKRAAIDAVVKRLDQVGLEDLVLDLHDGGSNRRRLATTLADSLNEVKQAQTPFGVDSMHRRLSRRRNRLDSYSESLHKIREPWEVSAYDVQIRLADMPDAQELNVRFKGDVLTDLSAVQVAELMDDLQEFVDLRGLQLLGAPLDGWGPAFASGTVRDRGEALGAVDAVDECLRTSLETVRSAAIEAAKAAGLRLPETLAEAEEILDLLTKTDAILNKVPLDAFQLDLPQLARDLGPVRGSFIERILVRLTSSSYRAALKQSSNLFQIHTADAADQLAAIEGARDISGDWNELGAGSVSKPPATADLGTAIQDLRTQLDTLQTLNLLPNAVTATFSDLRHDLECLQEYTVHARNMPELRRLHAGLFDAGLAEFLAAAASHDLGVEECTRALELAWLRSIERAILESDDRLGGFDGSSHYRTVETFGQSDQEHIASNAARVRRLWAEGVVRARDEFPAESEIVLHQARLKRRHIPPRALFQRASHVLRALKPCWVMSPLVVPQLLPLEAPPFDVVIFDEASQISPADAISSLLRAKQAVVAGDPYQLPPTKFFAMTGQVDDDDEEEPNEPNEVTMARDSALTQNIESILDVLRGLLPSAERPLRWHYRSRDERLIALSNAQETLYAGSIVTFPGALGDDCLTLELADQTGFESTSSSNEVERVVDLILTHASERPEETLGVIAMGAKHADRISETLRLRLQQAPELDEFFSEEREEPFFVKNLERVQGDERDAIILTIGYGWLASGKLSHNFGPINQEGGERRLNVAVTRARRRMTVVSTFTANDLDPDKLRKPGPVMLRDLLKFAESNGNDLDLLRLAKPELNAFERNIRDRLIGAGIPVVAQYGVSGYWIDFAAMHPEQPGKPILAIEADGATYHSSPTARDRDRLRQQHLESLGWRFHRIWSTDWFRDSTREVARVRDAYDRAVAYEKSGANEDSGQEVSRSLPPPPVQKRRRQPVPGGRSIRLYSNEDLERVIAWVKEDDEVRTEDELLQAVMETLKFRKRGTKIVSRIEAAIQASQATR